MTHPTAPANDFSATLQLPRTSFPMRANLPAREPAWVQRWLDEDVYGQLLAKRRAANDPAFVVHLGPPYANGNFHLGHTLAYGLKDIIVRHKFFDGYASPYVPGWDCHGLPIEWKIEQELLANGQSKRDLSVVELRNRCRAYAQKWMDVQQAEWQRMGVLADWQRPYRTMDKANEAGIVHCLGKLVQRGMVYNKLRSTLWAPVEETALAEAEIEYDDNHKSTAIYVALKVNRDLNKEFYKDLNEYLVVWTTTPWTLPANKAVALSFTAKYVGIVIKEKSENSRVVLDSCYWVAEDCSNDFCSKFGIKKYELLPSYSREAGIEGEDIIKNGGDRFFRGYSLLDAFSSYRHPLYNEKQGQVYKGEHVTTDSGTGLVHIAPAHGAEDFALGQEHGLELACPVNGSGRYEAYVDEGLPEGLKLAGRSVLDKAVTADILTALGDKLLHSSTYTHKYPISWRSKAPVIFRTTHQWFVDLDGAAVPETKKSIRETALDLIHQRGGHPAAEKGVNWVPGYGENRIGSMIAGRPDWCISRQRAWGVPITIMVDKATGQPVADKDVWTHIEALVAAEGIDAWDSRLNGREQEFFPQGWLETHGKMVDDFSFVRDILDVWFDSGTTWHHVVKADSAEGERFFRADGKRVADVYEEGSDQHRGWFHSSLLTSVALTGDAPYESVVTHGFVVDGQGRKFSKSLGNGVTPGELLDKYGMDIIRLWVGGSDYAEEVRYSPQMMDAAADQYRALRNAFRWLLGNLPENGGAVASVAPEALPELERYILHRLGTVLAEVRKDYDAFHFHTGVRTLQTFISTELSNFYFEVRRDTLYCDHADSPERVACVWMLEQIFRGLVTHLAPVIPFTTDEAWRSRYGEGACVHLEEYAVPEEWRKDEDFVRRWEVIMRLTGKISKKLGVELNFVTLLKEIEIEREKGSIKGNLECYLKILVNKELFQSKYQYGITLEEVKKVNWAQLVAASGYEFLDEPEQDIPLKFVIVNITKKQTKCPRCWRYYGRLEASGVCLRCEDALGAQQPVEGAV